MPILSPGISFFYPPLLLLRKQRAWKHTEGASLRPLHPICILLEIISPIFRPSQYFAAYLRRFKLQNCIPKKEGKLHREDSKRNAKEVGGERRKSNKRMQFTKGGGSCALYYKLYGRGTSLESFNALQASHYPEFRRLISKSAFYLSKFASSRCLWTRCKGAKEVDNKRCIYVLIWTKKQRF